MTTRKRNDTTVSVTKCCMRKLDFLAEIEGISKSRLLTMLADDLLFQHDYDPADAGFHACSWNELGQPLTDAEIDALLDDLVQAA